MRSMVAPLFFSCPRSAWTRVRHVATTLPCAAISVGCAATCAFTRAIRAAASWSTDFTFCTFREWGRGLGFAGSGLRVQGSGLELGCHARISIRVYTYRQSTASAPRFQVQELGQRIAATVCSASQSPFAPRKLRRLSLLSRSERRLCAPRRGDRDSQTNHFTAARRHARQVLAAARPLWSAAIHRRFVCRMPWAVAATQTDKLAASRFDSHPCNILSLNQAASPFCVVASLWRLRAEVPKGGEFLHSSSSHANRLTIRGLVPDFSHAKT